MKKAVTLLLAFTMLFTLAACGVSSSSSSQTTVTVTKTDDSGTTTSTVTSNVGTSVGTDGMETDSDVTAEGAEDSASMRDAGRERWLETFPYAAYGEDVVGDDLGFYLLWDDSEEITLAVEMCIDKPVDQVYEYLAGSVVRDDYFDDSYYLEDDADEGDLTFTFLEAEGDEDFILYFPVDDYKVPMHMTDTEETIDIMLDYLF